MSAARVVTATQNNETLNFRNLVLDVLWFGLAFPAIDRFRDVYSIRLGAETSQLTLMASLPALMLLVTSTLAGYWLRRFSTSRMGIRTPGFIFRLMFLLPALTPFMPSHLQIPWLVMSVVLPAIGQGVSAVGFVVMMREAVSGRRFADLNGKRTMIMNISVAASALAMGFWLEKAPFPLNYQVMFIVAFALSMISWWHVDRVNVIPELVAPPPEPSSKRVNPWKFRDFQLVAFIVALCFVSFTAIKPILTLYMVNNLKADEWFLSNFALIELIAGAVIAFFTVPLVERFGNRTLIAAGLIGTSIAALIIACASSLPVTLISAAVGGAAWAIVSIGQFSYFGEMTPSEHKSQFTTAYHQVAFTAMFIGPMLGQLFISANIPIVTAICIGAGLRLLAGILTHVRPPQWVTRAVQLRLRYSPR